MFDSTKVCEEIFGTLRSFDYDVAMFGEVNGESGVKTYEPSEARLFYTRPKNITVSLHEDGENSSLYIYLGKSVNVSEVQSLLDTLRRCSTKFGILFNVRRFKCELEPKDFVNGTVLESKKLTGSTKSSYLKLEGARMIIRHDATVDEEKHGARSRNIRKIFIENANGERLLMPSSNIMSGRAMTRHISKEGQFHDEVGSTILELAEEQSQMKNCASYCRKNKKKLDEDVVSIVETCVKRAKDIRDVFEGLFRRYDKTVGTVCEQKTALMEQDDELFEQKVNTLRKKLKLEDDSVIDKKTCESVTRVLGDSTLLEKKEEMIHLEALGVDVELDAWNNFKLDNPSIAFINDTAPNLSAANGMLSPSLTLVANACSADAFANMLSQVSQWLEDGRTDALLKHIAKRAIYIAKNHANVGDAKPLVKTPSKDNSKVEETLLIVNKTTKKLDEWFDGFTEEKIFEDDTGSRFPEYVGDDDDKYESALDKSFSHVEQEFNVDDFLVMSGEDFGYGNEDYDKEVEASTILTALKSYLNSEIGNEISAYVEVSHDEFGDMSAIAKGLVQQVFSKLESEGYVILNKEAIESEENDDENIDNEVAVDEFDLDFDKIAEDDDDGLNDNEEMLLGSEDSDLSSEDVLLPVNKKNDFKRDVAADKSNHHDGEDDEAYINRLQALAGIKYDQPQRLPQP